jgi:hypothetical protein
LKVAVERECEWTANPSAAWIVVTSGKQGQGEGTISYRVAENAEPLTRRGTISVSNQSIQIAQEAAPCRFSVSPSQLAAAAAGADLSVTVRTHTACTWTAAPGASWATIAPPAGQGDGAVQVHVVANTGGARATDLTVAGVRVRLAQEARGQTPGPPPPPDPAPPAPPPPEPNPPAPPPAPPPPAQCSYDLSRDDASFNALGGFGDFTVRTGATCQWTAVSGAGWVTILGASTGTGNGEVRFAVAPNLTSSSRSATVTVQSKVFRITQERAGERRVDGKISALSGSCPNLRFSVDDWTVTTGPNTEFRKGDCSKARDGEKVTVRGFAMPDRTLLASRVDFD